MTTRRLRFPIYGLGCGGGGADYLERRLADAPGVVEVYVNPATEAAYVEYDPTRTDVRQLVWVIDQAGYRSGPPSGS